MTSKGPKKPVTPPSKTPTTPKTSPAPKQAPDALTGEEQALWRYVATSITPIKAKPHVRRGGAATEGADDADAPVPPRRPSRAKSAPSPPPSPSARIAAPAARATPPLADFDPRKAKKISSGRVGIDARIDLHGMRQDDALARLRAFLFDAHARGLKTVLVITGKGRAQDDPTMPYVDTLDRFPRGVLRRNLPHWLAEPDLRAIVVSITQASQRHGGDGAFYVELRRKR
jgi:DNA-nicking Smr family endonuclease